MSNNLTGMLFVFVLNSVLYPQVPAIQNFPVDLGFGPKVNSPLVHLNDPNHYSKIKLKEISFDCENYSLYPVFIEDFNYISDVEQNFQFLEWLFAHRCGS